MILAVETSGPRCMVALGHPEDLQPRAMMELQSPQAHSEQLFQMIESVMASAGCCPDNLSAVAVSMGPGSFTGLRIGLSAAKGLCYGLDIPLVGVPTPDVVAHGVGLDGQFHVASVSRKHEYYHAVYDGALRTGEIDVLPENELADQIGIGDGLVCPEPQGILALVPAAITRTVRTIAGTTAMPDVAHLLRLAGARFLEGKFEDLANVVPLYVQGFRGRVTA